jgi:GTP-binding protein Era
MMIEPAGRDAGSDAVEKAGDGESRAGFVALLGPPNAGKSSLLNALLGERLAIVTAKPQTTRSRLLGILPRGSAQILFLDTPGLHRSTKKLNVALNDVVAEVSRDCDLALLLVDRARGWSEIHDVLASSLRALARPTLVVGTKSDLDRARSAPWPITEAGTEWPAIAVSARTGEGLEALLDAIVDALPLSPPLYDGDELTDRPMRFLCAEMIREAAFEMLDQELPYSIAVEVVRFDESDPRALTIRANLLVARDSQKRIVVGRGGSMIKRIGTRARVAIQDWLERRVHLELFVKVDPAWLKSRRRLEELGYH